MTNEEANAHLRDIGRAIKGAMPPGYGFVLMMFEFGESGNLFYCANAKREDVIPALKEFIQKTDSDETFGKHI